MSSIFERYKKKEEPEKVEVKPAPTPGSIDALLDIAAKKKAKLENTSEDTQRTQPTQRTKPNILNQPNVGNIPNVPNTDISPTKDFTKVPNSITREAIPDRLFKGMSKNTYDALYLKTRGAINPIRKIRATKSDLLRWTGVSDVTIDKHIKHLKAVGLLKVDFIIGSHEGNWYEVFIPEEIPNILNQPNQPNVPNKVGGEVPNLVGGDWVGKTIEYKDVSDGPKTSLKTIVKSDDERTIDGLSILATKLDAAAKKITGKGISKNEAEKWGNLADLLILELEIAASRSNGVSSVPSFLTEVLRRQFFSARQPAAKPSKMSSKTKPDVIGKPDDGPFEIKPLDEQGREAAFLQLQEFADDDFLSDFEKWYTAEDWKWLMGKLGFSAHPPEKD